MILAVFVNSLLCLNRYGLHTCSSQHTEQGNGVIKYHEEVSVYVKRRVSNLILYTEQYSHGKEESLPNQLGKVVEKKILMKYGWMTQQFQTNQCHYSNCCI